MANDKLNDIKKGDPILASQLQLLINEAKKSRGGMGTFNGDVGDVSRPINTSRRLPLDYGSNEQTAQTFLAKVLANPSSAGDVWIGSNGGIMCRIYFLHDHGSSNPVIVDEDYWITPPGDGSTEADYAEVAWSIDNAEGNDGTFEDGTLQPQLYPGRIITVSGVAKETSQDLADGNGNLSLWTGYLTKQPMPYTFYVYGALPAHIWADKPNQYLNQLGARSQWPHVPKDDTDAAESWRSLLAGNLRYDKIRFFPPAGAIPGLDWGTSWVDYRSSNHTTGWAYSIEWIEAPPHSMGITIFYRAVEDYKFTWVQQASTDRLVEYGKPTGTVQDSETIELTVVDGSGGAIAGETIWVWIQADRQEAGASEYGWTTGSILSFHRGQYAPHPDGESEGVHGSLVGFPPEVAEPPDPVTAFWARITGNNDQTNNRWTYDFVETEKTAQGYDGWSDVATGESGTAYNSIEDMNTDAGASIEGCGVRADHLDTVDWTFDIIPCPTDNIVWMHIVEVDGFADEYWFSYENGVDGVCD